MWRTEKKHCRARCVYLGSHSRAEPAPLSTSTRNACYSLVACRSTPPRRCKNALSRFFLSVFNARWTAQMVWLLLESRVGVVLTKSISRVHCYSDSELQGARTRWTISWPHAAVGHTYRSCRFHGGQKSACSSGCCTVGGRIVAVFGRGQLFTSRPSNTEEIGQH